MKDQLYGTDYVREEDPTLFMSSKTSRGPLNEGWIEEYWNEVQGRAQPTPRNMSLMCAYKLCRVEFRYWGMQTKLEKFIHDTALRKTMVRAHRQAWAWQDEWVGLTMDNIREIERQTQLALQKKMGLDGNEDEDEGIVVAKLRNLLVPNKIWFRFGSMWFPASGTDATTSKHSSQFQSIEKTEETPMFPKKHTETPQLKEQQPSVDSSDNEDDNIQAVSTSAKREHSSADHLSHHPRTGSKGVLHSPAGSTHSFDLQVIVLCFGAQPFCGEAGGFLSYCSF